MAKKSDEKIIKNRELGSLEGIPIGMKDLFVPKILELQQVQKF